MLTESYLLINIYSYVRTYVHPYIHTHIHTYMHTNTHTHTTLIVGHVEFRDQVNLNKVCGTICNVHVIRQASLCGSIHILDLRKFLFLTATDRPFILMDFFFALMSVQANTMVSAQIDSFS